MNHLPRLIALETTRKCPLSCKHCRAGATDKNYPNELTSIEIKKILKNVASFCKPIIILTGGEPLTRSDIFEIASYGKSLGLKMVLATCGYKLKQKDLEKLKTAGVERLSFSIDGATPEVHDSFRGTDGAFNETLNGIEIAKKVGLPFQINTTITKLNYKDLEPLLKLSINLGAASFHPFLLVPTGRAKSLKEIAITPDEYETLLEKIYSLAKTEEIEIKPTCGPQYHIISDLKNRGCLAGTGFAFISHTGKVQTCGFLDLECGDLRSENYNFKNVWENSEIFNKLRVQDNYTGKCGDCGSWKICGGCRARAHEMNGDYLGDEPYCGK